MAQDQRRDTASASNPTIDEVVDMLFEGTANQPGLKLLQLSPMIVLDRNHDGRVNARDVDPNDSDTAEAANLDIDLNELAIGMRQRLGDLALRFDTDGDHKLNPQEFQKFFQQIQDTFETEVDGPERAGPITTAQAIDMYDRAIHSGLPPRPPNSNRER